MDSRTTERSTREGPSDEGPVEQKKWPTFQALAPVLVAALGLATAALTAWATVATSARDDATDERDRLATTTDSLEGENATLTQENEELRQANEQLTTDLEAAEKQPHNAGESDSAENPGTSTRYLSDMEPVEGGSVGVMSHGEQEINGDAYPKSLAASIGCADGDARSEFNLEGDDVRFQASIGLSSDAEAGVPVTFLLEVNGAERVKRDVEFGEVVEIDEDIANARRLSLHVTTSGCYENRGLGVWGSARIS